MALFESKEVKRAKRDVAIRMGKKKVASYVADCRRMAGKYTELAKRALALGQQNQCDQYLLRRLQYEQQANKWDSFLLKMEDLAMRGQMSGAMGGLIEGMQALTKEIRAGVSVKSMTKTLTELNINMEQLGQTEEQLSGVMEGLDYDVGSPTVEDAVDIPAEMQESIGQLRSDLMDEVAVQEKVGEVGVGKTDIDKRIMAGRDRLRKIKGK